MRFGVKGFSVRDEWKIVPIELENIMHSNCKPLLLYKTTQHSGLKMEKSAIENVVTD